MAGSSVVMGLLELVSQRALVHTALQCGSSPIIACQYKIRGCHKNKQLHQAQPAMSDGQHLYILWRAWVGPMCPQHSFFLQRLAACATRAVRVFGQPYELYCSSKGYGHLFLEGALFVPFYVLRRAGCALHVATSRSFALCLKGAGPRWADLGCEMAQCGEHPVLHASESNGTLPLFSKQRSTYIALRPELWARGSVHTVGLALLGSGAMLPAGPHILRASQRCAQVAGTAGPPHRWQIFLRGQAAWHRLLVCSYIGPARA